MGNPTDELRARLDKLGVEYTANDEKHVKETCWPYMGELMAAFAEYDNGTTCFACDTWCFTPEQAIAATVGKDIEHYDGSGRRGTVAILQGGREPEEVLFVRYDGGVTHYLPEETCRKEDDYTCENVSGKWWEFKCSRCGYEVDESPDDLCNACPCCGSTIVKGESE